MARRIQHKRGLEVNLPILPVSELALTTDTKRPFIGGPDGNIELAKQSSLDAHKAENTYYKTVADMKSDTSLSVGTIVTTHGYLSVADGGGAKYRIVSGPFVDDGGSYHHITGLIFAGLMVADSINTKQFGITGLVDDTTQFLKALSFIASNRLELKLNSDVIVSQVILINDFYNITSDNKGRRIKFKDGATIDAIFKFYKYTWYVSLSKLVLDGNKANGAVARGILYDTNDANYIVGTCYVKDLYLQNFALEGIYVNGRCLIPNLKDIYIDLCDKQGLYYGGYDGTLNGIYVSNCGVTGGTEGAYFGGGNTKVSNVKVWFSGNYANAKPGIIIASTTSQYSCIEAQENYYAGVLLTGAIQNQLDIICDRNNMGNNPMTYGAVFVDGKENQVTIICKNNTNFGAIYEQTGLYISTNTFKNNNIVASVDGLHTTKLIDLSTTEYNQIVLNRVNFRDYYYDITPDFTIVVPVTTTGITVKLLKPGVYQMTGTAIADTTFWFIGAYGGESVFTIPKNHKVMAVGSPMATLNIFKTGTTVVMSGINEIYNYFTVDTEVTGISVKVLNGQTVDMIVSPKILVYEN